MKVRIGSPVTIFGLLAVICLTGGWNSCDGDAGKLVKKSPMQQFYLDNDWVPLPLPDSQFAPGSIFSYAKDTGLRWESSLQSCGVPDDVIKPVMSNSGKLTFNVSGDYGADLTLKISKVTVGPEWSKVKKVTLENDDHGPASLDMVKLNIWLTAPENANKFSPVCKAILSDKNKNIYVAQQSYRVSKGKLTLYDQNGAKIAVTGLQAGPVNIGADAHATATQDGSLEFDQLLYTAVRRLVFVNGGFQALGSATQPATPTADAEVISDMKNKVK
jgi:hypothetical protein